MVLLTLLLLVNILRNGLSHCYSFRSLVLMVLTRVVLGIPDKPPGTALSCGVRTCAHSSS